MILRPPRVNRTNPLFPDTTLFRSGRRARAHHRSHLLQADRRARAVAVPPGAQARRQTGVRLELRLPAPPRQIRQPLAAQALRLRPARHRQAPAAAGLSPDHRAMRRRARNPVLRTDRARRARHPAPTSAVDHSLWGKAVNRLVLSGTGAIVPSRTRSSCYRGPESSILLAKSVDCTPPNFSTLASFGIFLTDRRFSAAVDESLFPARPSRSHAVCTHKDAQAS